MYNGIKFLKYKYLFKLDVYICSIIKLMKQLFLSIFLLQLSFTCFGQEIVTNVKLGFSENVMKVVEIDSLGSDTIIYQFNDKGYLIESKLGNERFLLNESAVYENNKLVKKTKQFKNNFCKSFESKTFTYESERIKSSFEIVNGIDESGDKYNIKSDKKYTYKKGLLVSTKCISNKGRTVEENYFYNESNGLAKKTLITDKSPNYFGETIHIVEEEFRNENVVTINSHDKEKNLLFKEVLIYDEQKNLIQHTRFYQEEEMEKFLYTYVDGILVNKLHYLEGVKSNEIEYNNHGDVIKNAINRTAEYSYEYNTHTDIVTKKLYSGGTIHNIWKYSYTYK